MFTSWLQNSSALRYTIVNVSDKPKFLILDGHSLAYRAFHALPVENFATSSGQHTNAVYGFVSMLVNVLRDQKPTHIAVAFDISRDTFRTQAYPEYKAGRAKTPPEFKGQVELIKEVLKALNISVVTLDGFEADDILATLAAHAGMEVKIISGDRDSFQLVTDQVTILYPKMGMSNLALMTPEAVEEKYGVPPKKYRDLAALVGEKSDNLPGVPSVGEKTAAKWINQFGGVAEIIASADQITGKVGEQLRAHIDLVERNYDLNRLRDDIDIEKDPNAYVRRDYDVHEVTEILDKLEFAALRPRLFQAWGTTSGSAQDSQGEDSQTTADDSSDGFSVTGESVDAKGLSAWLKVHKKDRIAFALNGTWAAGRGSIDQVALVGEDSTGVWVDFEAARDELSEWFASTQPKVGHDLKGPLWALMDSGVRLESLVMDTALAAYLVAPGQRNFDVTSVVHKFLRKELDSADSSSGQLELGGDDSASGEMLLKHAQAIQELATVLEQELKERSAATLLSEVEIPVALDLADMERSGIAVDVKKLKALEESFEADAQQAVQVAHKAAGHEFNLGSPKQLQEVLFNERGLPKTKKIKTGYTTDAEALQSLIVKFPDDELLTALLRYREVSKLRQTVTGLLGCVADDGRIHTTFNQMVAATGRLSSTDPNLQNIPVRTTEGGQIRDTFVVGKGYETLLTADYSQIEMRVMAHLSGDEGLIAALTSGEDLHTTVGSQVFGVAPQDVNPDMRRQIKAMSYGLAYGLSAYGLAQQLGIGNDEAKSLMETYFQRFGGVRDYLANVVADARKKGYTETIMGRRRYLPDLNSDSGQLRQMAERMALNAPIQGSAADIVKVAMLKVIAALKENNLKSRVLLQVHDELVLEIAAGELDQVTELVKQHMQHAVELKVPMDVSVGVGTSWAIAAH